MPTVRLYNPCNDIALLRDTPVFTPPANAARFEQAGALLPLWISDPDDHVLAPVPDADWLGCVNACYDIGANVGPRIPDTVTGADPWGWSHNTVRRLADAGMSRDRLPDSALLDSHRLLSHRRTAIAINRRLAQLTGMTMPPEAIEADTYDAVARAVNGFGGEAIIKAPYSSSGRGIIDTAAYPATKLRDSISGLIRRQGSVTVERRLDRIMDLAMLFGRRADGSIAYLGLSMFDTSAGAYTGNILLDDSDIERRVAAIVGDGILPQLRDTLPDILDECVGTASPSRFMGVDMLVYRDDDGTTRIAPCIELNLRMTMGIYAHIWRRRHLHPASTGTLSVIPHRHGHPAPVLQPPVITARRLVSGILLLTPPNPHFTIAVTANTAK